MKDYVFLIFENGKKTKVLNAQQFSKKQQIEVLDHFGPQIRIPRKNNVSLCPPDLKRPTGGDFSSRQVNFDESCRTKKSLDLVRTAISVPLYLSGGLKN